MTLVEFLTARLDEDEVKIRQAKCGECLSYLDDTLVDRVLADVKAKRAIVEREHGLLRDLWRRRVDEHRLTFDEWLQEWPPATLRDLASVYADHPDYDATWAP